MACFSRLFIIAFQTNSYLTTILPFQTQITSIPEERKALVLILLISRFLCHKFNVFNGVCKINACVSE